MHTSISQTRFYGISFSHLIDVLLVVLQLGQGDADLLGVVRANGLGDLNGDGLACLPGLGEGDVHGDLLRLVHLGHPVLLGLVLLAALLVLPAVLVGIVRGLVVTAVLRRGGAARGHLHGLRLVLVGDLGDGGAGLHPALVVLIGADVPLHGPGHLLAAGAGLGIAELVVGHALDVEPHRLRLGVDAGHADLGVDGGVGRAAVHLGGGVAAAVVRPVGVRHRRSPRQRGERQQEEEILREGKTKMVLETCYNFPNM